LNETKPTPPKERSYARRPRTAPYTYLEGFFIHIATIVAALIAVALAAHTGAREGSLITRNAHLSG
jgi:hypothetical protein